MPSPEFSFPARALDAAGKALRFPVRAAWIRGAVEGTGVAASPADGALEVRLSKSGTDVVVRGSLSAELVVPCSRCLEPAQVSVKAALSALFVPASAKAGGARSAGGEEDDLEDGEGDLIGYDGETVVLDDLVRDELLLGIPMIPLCSEACAGIRPETTNAAARQRPLADPLGAEIDPRLLPLLSIKSKA